MLFSSEQGDSRLLRVLSGLVLKASEDRGHSLPLWEAAPLPDSSHHDRVFPSVQPEPLSLQFMPGDHAFPPWTPVQSLVPSC